MADKLKTTRTMTLLAGFADGDDRTITIENPNASINLAAAVVDLEKYLKENSVIIGDKAGAEFTSFKTAKLVTKSVTKLDI